MQSELAKNDDIVSVGFIAIIKAFERFADGPKDLRFSTYAVLTICGEIQIYLRKSGTGVYYPVHDKELAWKIRNNELEGLRVEEVDKMMDTKSKNIIHALI